MEVAFRKHRFGDGGSSGLGYHSSYSALACKNALCFESKSIDLPFRRQRTHEEAKKLRLVQAELQRMDARVSDDIKLLRKTIEDASLEFMEAQ